MNSNMLSMSLQLPQIPTTRVFVLWRVANQLNVLIARLKKYFIFLSSYSSQMQTAFYSAYSGPCAFITPAVFFQNRR